MAARLEVSEGWLSRYLALGRLPQEVVAAFPSIRDIRELHARTLKPLLAKAEIRAAVVAEARRIATERGQGKGIDAAQVVSRLRLTADPPRPRPQARQFRAGTGQAGVTARRGSRKTVLEVPDSMTRDEVEAALRQFVESRFGKP